MLPSVKLDDQLGGTRYEIADEWPDWDLAIEADAGELAIGQMPPESALGGRRVGS